MIISDSNNEMLSKKHTYQSKPHVQHHYRTATLCVLTILAITALCLVSYCHWNKARCTIALQQFFSTQLALKAGLVSLIGFSIIVIPYIIAGALIYKREHLKPKTCDNKILEKILKHNNSLLAIDYFLKKEIASLDKKGQEELMEALILEIIEDTFCDPQKVFEKFSRLLSLVEESGNDNENAMILLEKAKLELGLSSSPHASISVPRRVIRAFTSLFVVMGNIIAALGIASFFKPSQNDAYAGFKAQQLLVIVEICILLSTILVASVGGAQAGGIIIAFLSVLVIISIGWSKIKPIPPSLPNARNLTEEVSKNKDIPTGRETICRQILEARRNGQHVLLIGPSRAGKSSLTRELAYYAQLEGIITFLWNMSALADHSSSLLGESKSEIIDQITEQAGVDRHRNNLLFIFDEAHMAKGTLADILKTELDVGGKLPPCVAITTDKEYREHILPNLAFDNRFSIKIFLEQPDPTVTEAVLYKTLAQHYPHVLFTPEMISLIIETSTKNTDTPQPYSALMLLHAVAQKITQDSSSSSNQDIINLKTADSKAMGGKRSLLWKVTKRPTKEQRETFKEITKKASELKQQTEKQEILFEKLTRAKLVLHKITQTKNKTLVKTHGIATSHFLLLEHMEEKFREHIKLKSKELNVPCEITEELVVTTAAQIEKAQERAHSTVKKTTVTTSLEARKAHRARRQQKFSERAKREESCALAGRRKQRFQTFQHRVDPAIA